MRKVLLAGLTASLLTASVVPIGASVSRHAGSAPPAPAMVVQHQSGVAFGKVVFNLPTGDSPDTSTEFHDGTYVFSGQVSRGTYSFRMASRANQCAHAGDTITSAGTARLVRSDGAVLTGIVKTSAPCATGATVPTKYVVSLTRGSRDLAAARLDFYGTFTTYATPSSSIGLESWLVSGTASARSRIGYWMVDSAGQVYAFGGVNWLGNAPTRSAVHIEPTPSGGGYWIVDASGHVFVFGDARWFGNADPSVLAPGESITSLSATPGAAGYWLFTDRGRVLPFGNATFFGDLHTVRLNGPVIGSVATPTGRGYYMVARDGGIFAFGDAKFRGSMGASPLNQPVVGLVPTSLDDGYWLVAGDGGVFSFGHARFLGSMGSVPLRRPVIGMVNYGGGYMMVAQDGGIFDFSPAPFFGSLGDTAIANPIVSAAAVYAVRPA